MEEYASKSDRAEWLSAYITTQRGLKVRCVGAHVDTFNRFYVNVVGFQEQLTKLTKKLNLFYDNEAIRRESTPTSTSLTKGLYVAVSYHRQGAEYGKELHRGLILRVFSKDGNTKYKVFLIDFGNTTYVTIADIKYLKKGFLVLLPAQAIECRVRLNSNYDGYAKNNYSWSAEEVRQFGEALSQKFLEVEFIKTAPENTYCKSGQKLIVSINTLDGPEHNLGISCLKIEQKIVFRVQGNYLKVVKASDKTNSASVPAITENEASCCNSINSEELSMTSVNMSENDLSANSETSEENHVSDLETTEVAQKKKIRHAFLNAQDQNAHNAVENIKACDLGNVRNLTTFPKEACVPIPSREFKKIVTLQPWNESVKGVTKICKITPPENRTNSSQETHSSHETDGTISSRETLTSNEANSGTLSETDSRSNVRETNLDLSESETNFHKTYSKYVTYAEVKSESAKRNQINFKPLSEKDALEKRIIMSNEKVTDWKIWNHKDFTKVKDLHKNVHDKIPSQEMEKVVIRNPWNESQNLGKKQNQEIHSEEKPKEQDCTQKNEPKPMPMFADTFDKEVISSVKNVKNLDCGEVVTPENLNFLQGIADKITSRVTKKGVTLKPLFFKTENLETKVHSEGKSVVQEDIRTNEPICWTMFANAFGNRVASSIETVESSGFRNIRIKASPKDDGDKIPSRSIKEAVLLECKTESLETMEDAEPHSHQQEPGVQQDIHMKELIVNTTSDNVLGNKVIRDIVKVKIPTREMKKIGTLEPWNKNVKLVMEQPEKIISLDKLDEYICHVTNHDTQLD